MTDLENLRADVSSTLYYLTGAGKQIKQELKAIKKLCDVRLENYEENEEYKELSQHLIRNKKEIKAFKRIDKILKEVSD